MPWSRPFDDPIGPQKGKKLVTLMDAAAFIRLNFAKRQALGKRKLLRDQ
jgi:hypothetical protein